MNQTISDMMTRRSVRTFEKKAVKPEDLQTVIEAGFAAPSAHGARPFRLAILEHLDIRERLTSVMTWFQPIVNAPVALLVLGDPTVCTMADYWTVDCAAFIQNILLAARSLGLGTVWCGIAPNQENIEKIEAVLDIPSPLIPFCVIALGYPTSSDSFKTREFHDADHIFQNPEWIKN